MCRVCTLSPLPVSIILILSYVFETTFTTHTHTPELIIISRVTCTFISASQKMALACGQNPLLIQDDDDQARKKKEKKRRYKEEIKDRYLIEKRLLPSSEEDDVCFVTSSERTEEMLVRFRADLNGVGDHKSRFFFCQRRHLFPSQLNLVDINN